MRRSRGGFTIVELLVVTGIIATLFGLIAAANRGEERGGARRAAQEFASQLLAAQSRALGRPEGAAVIVEADVDNARQGTVIQEAGMPPPMVVGAPNGALQNAPADGYKVRFQATSGSGMMPVSPWLALSGGRAVRRQSAGQTPENTLDGPVAADEAVVVRRPVEGPEPVTLSKQVAIDLRHSGVGDDASAAHGCGRLEGLSPVALVFDPTGRVAEVIRRVDGGGSADPIVPNEIIYFLFTERDAIDRDASLTSDEAFWVAVNPQTGRINVSANVPSTSGSLSAARFNARQAIAVGK